MGGGRRWRVPSGVSERDPWFRDGAAHRARECVRSSARPGKFAGNSSSDLSACHVDLLHDHGRQITRTTSLQLARTFWRKCLLALKKFM